jgi:hypothetical protein
MPSAENRESGCCWRGFHHQSSKFTFLDQFSKHSHLMSRAVFIGRLLVGMCSDNGSR